MHLMERSLQDTTESVASGGVYSKFHRGKAVMLTNSMASLTVWPHHDMVRDDLQNIHQCFDCLDIYIDGYLHEQFSSRSFRMYS